MSLEQLLFRNKFDLTIKMKESKAESSLFSSKRIVKESDAVESNCCGGIKKQATRKSEKQENAVCSSKKISCSMLRSKKNIQEFEKIKASNKKSNQQQQIQMRDQTVFVKNISIVPPINSYHHHHHYYHIVQPTQTPRIQYSKIQSTQQSQNKQMFFSTRTTFPSCKLSSLQNQNSSSSLITPSNQGVLNLLHPSSSHPLQGLKLRYSQSKNMDYTKQPTRLQQSQIISKLFTSHQLASQTNKLGQY